VVIEPDFLRLPKDASPREKRQNAIEAISHVNGGPSIVGQEAVAGPAQ
jgi:hypothetical protein